MEVEHQNLYGGLGIVKITIVDVDLVSPFESVNHYKVEPRASIGRHQHQVDSTLLIVTFGVGEIIINGTVSILSAQDTVMIPRQAQVSLQNISESDVFAFWIVRGRP